jgi:molybdopterin-guanine dinucleotide biosynthesis protein A
MLTTTILPSQITGLVLAGGRGSRMGGVDKGLQSFRGVPMVLHVIMRLRPQVGACIVNANQNIAAYEGFGFPVMPDRLGGFEGPLAGLQVGLSHCATDYLVTAPCDSPFLPPDLVSRLAAALAAADAELALAVTDEQGRRQPQPVFCLMKVGVLPSLDAFLRDGGRKIDDWRRSLASVEVPFADANAFRNINTVDELRRFESP